MSVAAWGFFSLVLSTCLIFVFGIKKVLIPEGNVKDLVEIPDNIKNRLEIQPVKWIEQVLSAALERDPQPLSEDEIVAPPVPLPTSEANPSVIKH